MLPERYPRQAPESLFWNKHIVETARLVLGGHAINYTIERPLNSSVATRQLCPPVGFINRCRAQVEEWDLCVRRLPDDGERKRKQKSYFLGRRAQILALPAKP